MIVAIPNANQTFREITFNVVSQTVETDIRPRVFYQDFPGLGPLRPRGAGPRPAGWKKLMVAKTGQAARPRSISPNAAGWSSTGPSGRSTWSWSTAPSTGPAKPGDDRRPRRFPPSSCSA